ncbi:ribonuclease H-like domain-containing protein [Tanacetum coccineum]
MLSDSYCRDAMYDEYNALVKNDLKVVLNLALLMVGQFMSLTLRMCRILEIITQWKIHGLAKSKERKMLFLNGDVSQIVYMYPTRSVDPRFPNMVVVCKGHYGLKQASCAWFQPSSIALVQCIISSIHQELDMTDSGPFNYFLRISATCDSTVYAKSKLGLDRDLLSDPTLYSSLGGGIHYLTFTSPDITYVVQHIRLFVHDPWEPQLASLKQGFVMFVDALYAVSMKIYSKKILEDDKRGPYSKETPIRQDGFQRLRRAEKVKQSS